jgi:alpha-tubulin suppressor-like RCC1 family protein
MNVNQIELALSQKISASSSNFDLLAAAKALQLLKTNGVFVVSSYGGLPAAASNEGKIYFIEDIETVVWSNGTDWLRLLDKNTIQFQLWSWGNNSRGMLGNASSISTCSPVQEICLSTNWSQVSAGSCHTTALKTSGEIWSWGCTEAGLLGNGENLFFQSRCSPVREFCSATNWCQIDAGNSRASAIKTDGSLWAWGCNNGALGNGLTITSASPVREFCSATDWLQVSAGGQHIAAIKTSGQIWVWGNNINGGTLGDGTTENSCSPIREFCSATDWCQVSAGGTHTTAIKTTGQLWVWGNNAAGRLGDGTATSRCSPVQEFCSATDWCQVSAGGYHTAGIKNTGEIWIWGCGTCGRLGDGTLTNRCSPIREFCSATDWCGVSTSDFIFGNTSAIKTSGQIWSWGANFGGQLGDGTVATSCSPVREISSATNWNQVTAGGQHTAAIKII